MILILELLFIAQNIISILLEYTKERIENKKHAGIKANIYYHYISY